VAAIHASCELIARPDTRASARIRAQIEQKPSSAYDTSNPSDKLIEEKATMGAPVGRHRAGTNFGNRHAG
jgi:hypothetical protein